MLHIRRTNVSLSNFSFPRTRGSFLRTCRDAHPSRTFDIAVSKGTRNITEMIEAVEVFGRDLGSCTPTRDIRVKIETLTSASRLTSAPRHTSIAVKAGCSSIGWKLLEELPNGAVRSEPVLALGQLGLDRLCKEAYDQFWGEGEWAL
jgi:hypothetical protein